MNPLFSGLMNEAAELTRTGQLAKATEAIQRALRGEANARPAAPATGPDDTDVIDVEARVIERERPAHTPPPREEQGEADVWTRASFAHKGRSIDYMLFVPKRAAGEAATPRPVVLMLHGCTQSAADFAAGTRMNEHARGSGAIVVYAEQTQRAHGQKCWNWFKTPHQQRGRGEPELLAALTQHIVAQQDADRLRVYVAGLSAGGAMADILGHCYPDIYAAIGVHSGLPHGAAHDMMSALNAMRSGPAASGSGPDVSLAAHHCFSW